MKNIFLPIFSLLLIFSHPSMGVAQLPSSRAIAEELKVLQKQLVPDARVAILDIVLKDTLQPAAVLSGESDQPDAIAKISNWLTEKGIVFTDSVRLLPAAHLGDKGWALATLSVSNLRAQPGDASELVSQALMGTPMRVLNSRKGWVRVQTPDAYIGWMDDAGLQRLTADELDRWKGANRYFYHEISGFVYDAPGRNGDVVSDIVLGDLFEVTAEAGSFLQIKTPDGRSGYLPKSACLSWNRWSQQQPDGQTMVRTARQMMGTPYLWGGCSAKAADCSGFVKLLYYTQGIILARDASQQAQYGKVIDDTQISLFQTGDLLFFGKSAQRVTHVGFYLTDGYFIHSSGKVHISSIVPADPKYVPERNRVAVRRVVGAVGQKGITRVADHPWYSANP